jgi:hypothetical protein
VSQRHSQVNEIIAREARKDSSSMKTIAALNMLFLPGTYIATIFGMPFFTFSDTGLTVYGQWWIYVAVTVPTTITLFVIWWAWNRVSCCSIRSAFHWPPRVVDGKISKRRNDSTFSDDDSFGEA